MRKSEVFHQVLSVVSEETEIPEKTILSKSKNTENVDARYLLVYFLSRYGLRAPAIAEMMNYSRRPIEKMISQFEIRRKQGRHIFEMLTVRIASKLRFCDD